MQELLNLGVLDQPQAQESCMQKTNKTNVTFFHG